MVRCFRRLATILSVVVLALIALYGYLTVRPAEPVPKTLTAVPPLNHVFVIMMENHSLDALSSRNAPYIHQLIRTSGYDFRYYGVTHVSLPNYVALLSGSTHGTFSDNPDQTFSGPTLVSQLDAHHISWQGVMQSLPHVGYTGNWYPEKPGTNPVLMPKNALYAKKHDPFMLFPAIAQHDVQHIVPLTTLTSELKSGQVPRFVWITPNLCSDMHGQPAGSADCPSGDPQKLVRLGNRFLASLIPEIKRSPAFTGHSVIFVTWDEAQMPAHAWSLAQWKQWLEAGPAAPREFGIPVGGGSVPLITIIPGTKEPPHIALWADHYNLLKTIESGFGLSYIGHAESRSVVPLGSLVKPR